MATEFKERALPHDAEVEKSILGAVLLDNQAFAEAAQTVTAEDFFNEQNRFIYEENLAEAMDATADFVRSLRER